MRHTILLLMSLVLGTMMSYAEGLTATLTKSDKSIEVFYGEGAFREAYNKATDGNIITLSGGSFNSPDSLTKSITVIGNGAFTDTATTQSPITQVGTTRLSADNIVFEGINISSLYIGKSQNVSVRRCYISWYLHSSGAHSNTSIEDCAVGDFYALKNSTDCYIKNCTISYFRELNAKEKLAVIEDTHVRYWFYNNSSDYKQPYAIYRNCALGFYSSSSRYSIPISAPSEFYDVLFLIRPWASYDSLSSYYQFSYGTGVKYSGLDRTIVTELTWPVYTTWVSKYGCKDFKFYPSIPRVTSSEIDSQTDADGKLKVKINVAIGE